MTGYNPVEYVDERRGVERSEEASQRTRFPDFGQQRYTSSRVAGNRGSVAKDEPPAFVPRFFDH